MHEHCNSSKNKCIYVSIFHLYARYKTSFDPGNSLRDDHHDAHGILLWRMENRDFFTFYTVILPVIVVYWEIQMNSYFMCSDGNMFSLFFIHFFPFKSSTECTLQSFYEKHDTFNSSSNMKTKYHHLYDFVWNKTFNTNYKKLHKYTTIKKDTIPFLLYRDFIRIICHYGRLKCFLSVLCEIYLSNNRLKMRL